MSATRLRAATVISAALVLVTSPPFSVAARADVAVDQSTVLAAVEEVAPIVEEVGQTLWDLAEVSLLEVKSADSLKTLLQANGFTITSEGTAGVPTAFIAEYGSGEPRLGVMLEYDALPGLGNAAVPRQEPREDGVTSGHGCGHNLIGAGGIGAALAIKALMEQHQIVGTLRIYGGAAEESEGAKVFMARDGAFDDLDAMLHLHPMDFARVANVRMAAAQHLYVEFTGKSAHAGVAPWTGRSALDGAEIFTHSLNLMREHVEPTARIHYIFRDGGTAPNVVPDRAVVMMTYRDADRARVDAGVAWIKDMAAGAALATQTEVLAVDYFGLHDVLPNTPLAERMHKHYEAVGLPDYTEEELAFATELQEAAGLEPAGMTDRIDPIPDEPHRGGFSDIGDVSYITPTMGITVPTVPRGVGLHTWMATASNGTSIATKGAMIGAQVLALTGIDILTDAEFRAAARADLEARTEGYTYTSPIPDFIKEPSGLPDEMRQFDSRMELEMRVRKATSDHFFGGHSHDHPG